MANLTGLEASNSTNLVNTTNVWKITCLDRYHNGLDNEDFTTAIQRSYIIAIIVNSITCPFTVLLNVLVITAVKKRPRLQNNANIMLACLAATDVLTGILVQPSFVLWKAFQLNAIDNKCMLRKVHNRLLSLMSSLSLLHLSLVTAERLIAIKYSLRYLSIVTRHKIRVAVITVWVFCFIIRPGIILSFDPSTMRYSSMILLVFLEVSCIPFIIVCYAILFREISRHQKVIKTQRQHQNEAERFARENKAFKTTLFVVGALLASYVPFALFLLFRPKNGYGDLHDVVLPWVRTFAMLNSLFNPLIYCWRQAELRKSVLQMLHIGNQ